MRIALDALYENKPAPPDVLASLSDDERAEIASLARTARLVGLSLNQPVPTAEMQASALARAHEAMAARPDSRTVAPPISRPADAAQPVESAANGNWFTRLFKKPDG